MNHDDLSPAELRRLRRSVFWTKAVLWRVCYVSVVVALISGAVGYSATQQFGLSIYTVSPLVGIVASALLLVFRAVILDPAVQAEIERRKNA